MKYFLIIIFIPIIIYSFNFYGEYDFYYFYFQNISYYGLNRLILNAKNSNSIISLNIQLIGDYYINNARYHIYYPDDIPDWLINSLPSYYNLNNSLRMNYLYVSMYWKRFNVKLGKIPFNWGISQIYSPIELSEYNNPFNLYGVIEGINALQLKYSISDNTLSFLYVDNGEYERTKQALMYNNINKYFSLNAIIAHYFDFSSGDFFNADTVEYIIGGINILTDYYGPGLWVEGDVFFNADMYKYYILTGIDYTIFDLYLSFEYIRNSNGKYPPYSYIEQLNRIFYKRFLIGKNYGVFTCQYKISNMNFNIISLTNLNDYSNAFILSAIYSPKVFLKLSLSMFFNNGNNNEDFYTIAPIYMFNLKYNF